jgi:hypothetical protein
MHPIITDEIAAQRISAQHQAAADQRLLRDLRAASFASLPDSPSRGGRVRLSLRRFRPVAV